MDWMVGFVLLSQLFAREFDVIFFSSLHTQWNCDVFFILLFYVSIIAQNHTNTFAVNPNTNLMCTKAFVAFIFIFILLLFRFMSVILVCCCCFLFYFFLVSILFTSLPLFTYLRNNNVSLLWLLFCSYIFLIMLWPCRRKKLTEWVTLRKWKRKKWASYMTYSITYYYLQFFFSFYFSYEKRKSLLTISFSSMYLETWSNWNERTWTQNICRWLIFIIYNIQLYIYRSSSQIKWKIREERRKKNQVIACKCVASFTICSLLRLIIEAI